MRNSPLLLGLWIAFAPISFVSAQNLHLLKDINSQSKKNPSSFPGGYSYDPSTPWNRQKFPILGNWVVFSANDGVHGYELWKFSLTQNKALLLKDLVPGPGGSLAGKSIKVGNKIIFSATHPAHGEEPWVTDGTTAGTHLLKDCLPGYMSGRFIDPVLMGGKAYWTSYNGAYYDIWTSDGTSSGTRMVARGLLHPWTSPVTFGKKILFRNYTFKEGEEPWVTDGTYSGTTLLKDINPGSASGDLYYPAAIGDKCYFFSYTGSSYALFVTDGTEKGTRKILGGFKEPWSKPVVLGNKIVFRGTTSTDGAEPWVTDGTPGGTRILKNIRPGTNSGGFDNPILFNGKLYFQACLPSSYYTGLWVTDGTTQGTKVITGKTSLFKNPAASGKYIFFMGKGTHWEELWKTDGTSQGTVEVKDINIKAWSKPSFITGLGGGKVLFTADDGIHGKELWISDGTAEGTRLVRDIYPPQGTYDSNPADFVDVCGITYFTADDGIHRRKLWRTDGTREGTYMVMNANPWEAPFANLTYSTMFRWRNGGPVKPAALGRILFFLGRTAREGDEIWRTDGTAKGTFLLKDIRPGSLGGGFYHGCVLGDRFFFSARGRNEYGIWKTDGTKKGTKEVAGPFPSYWKFPIPLGEKIIFQGNDNKTGFEPWVTDGTRGGTRILKDIAPGPSSGQFLYPVKAGGKVFFFAEPSYGFSLWVTDGTEGGTRRLGYWQRPFERDLVAFKGKVFFQGWDPKNGAEIWVSDGTLSGTKLFKDLYPGNFGAGFRNPCVSGDFLYFSANRKGYEKELWKTDGTPEGTVMVKDIRPGAYGSLPRRMLSLGGGRVVFWADDGVHGVRPWFSDGTSAGTFMIGNIRPKTPYDPIAMALSGGKVFILASDGIHGFEPWVWFPGATAQRFGFATSDSYPFTASVPALGRKAGISLSGMKWGQAAVFVLAVPTHTPAAFTGGWIYFDPSNIYTAAFLSPGGGSSLKLSVPNEPSLTGGQAALQAMVFPTPRAPWSVDLTNAVLLTFGR